MLFQLKKIQQAAQNSPKKTLFINELVNTKKNYNKDQAPRLAGFFFQIPQVGPLARIPRALINIKWRLF
jgi:hypothetical protein